MNPRLGQFYGVKYIHAFPQINCSPEPFVKFCFPVLHELSKKTKKQQQQEPLRVLVTTLDLISRCRLVQLH